MGRQSVHSYVMLPQSGKLIGLSSAEVHHFEHTKEPGKDDLAGIDLKTLPVISRGSWQAQCVKQGTGQLRGTGQVDACSHHLIGFRLNGSHSTSQVRLMT